VLIDREQRGERWAGDHRRGDERYAFTHRGGPFAGRGAFTRILGGLPGSKSLSRAEKRHPQSPRPRRGVFGSCDARQRWICTCFSDGSAKKRMWESSRAHTRRRFPPRMAVVDGVVFRGVGTEFGKGVSLIVSSTTWGAGHRGPQLAAYSVRLVRGECSGPVSKIGGPLQSSGNTAPTPRWADRADQWRSHGRWPPPDGRRGAAERTQRGFFSKDRTWMSRAGRSKTRCSSRWSTLRRCHSDVMANRF